MSEKLVPANDPPSGRVRDVAFALINLFPGGSIGGLLLDQIWTDPRAEGQRIFLVSLARRLKELEDAQVIDVGECLSRPETQPLLLRAVEAAARSIGEKKLEALRNATVQGLFERTYLFDLSVMVFALLDRLTEGHVIVLQSIKQSGGMSEEQACLVGMGPRTKYQEGETPFTQRFQINQLILDDLKNMGLVEVKSKLSPVAKDWRITEAQINATSLLRLTAKGKLVYEHIFPGD